MPKKEKKVVCLTCKHWNFSASEDDWSDTTPGNLAQFICLKNHFYYDGSEIPNLAEFLRVKKICGDFIDFNDK